jgi:hypothetical protein
MPMTQTREEFVEIVRNIRTVLKTEECAECPCPNTRCEWHGDCYSCIRIYRHFGNNVPSCLQPAVAKKIGHIIETAESQRQPIPNRSDAHYDYLYSVTPMEQPD